MFVKIEDGGKLLIVCLYVDDLVFTGNDGDMFNELKKFMMKEFEMTDLGKMHYVFGLEVVQFDDKIFLLKEVCAGNTR